MLETRIKELREDRDLIQKDIALLLNITQANYSRIENEIQELDYKGLKILSKFYNVSIDYILKNDNNKSRESDNWFIIILEDNKKGIIYLFLF